MSQQLLAQLIRPIPYLNKQDQEQLQQYYYRSFRCEQSQCVLLIGPSNCGKKTMAEVVAKQFNPFIIRISGIVSTDDTSSLTSIAVQYGQQKNLQFQGNYANEAIQFLRDFSAQQDNVLLIIDQIDRFAHKNLRQTLLYTLFEFIEEQYFNLCIVGITSKLNITELFEKRIRSRFQSQAIMCFDVDIENQLEFLYSKLNGQWLNTFQSFRQSFENLLLQGRPLKFITNLLIQCITISQNKKQLKQNIENILHRLHTDSLQVNISTLPFFQLLILLLLTKKLHKNQEATSAQIYREYLMTKGTMMLTLQYTENNVLRICRELKRLRIIQASNHLGKDTPLQLSFPTQQIFQIISNSSQKLPTAVESWFFNI